MMSEKLRKIKRLGEMGKCCPFIFLPVYRAAGESAQMRGRQRQKRGSGTFFTLYSRLAKKVPAPLVLAGLPRTKPGQQPLSRI